uniref:AAA+ ATPase domain-containing protein n=1 Tax=Salix viminalis TaxID=40686 RepID=A0A6N2N8H0_SALVM
MAVDIVISIIGKIGEFLVEPIGRQFDFLIHHNSNIETLKDQVQILEEVRKNVQGSVDAAMAKGETIKNEVRNWMSRADGVILEARKTLEDDADPNKRWFNKWFLDLASRYRLSREADNKITAIAKIKVDGQFDNVSMPAAPPEIVSQDFVIFESTRLAIMEIMEALEGDKINFIGIHGMAGVGKTTLVKEIERRAKEDMLFDAVVMAVVSRSVEVKNIQQQIADMLGFKLDEKREQGRAGRLRARLKSVDKILIILDDIWDTLDLASIGIPFGDDDHNDPENVNCKVRKIVVTTRCRQVCNSMTTGIETSKIIHLNALSENESWGLLKMNAGEVMESPELNSVAKKICRECGGLPVALVTVGRTMRDKAREEWEEAALELQKPVPPSDNEGTNEIVYKCVKLSYDHLRNRETKSMFLLCCLFPEDYSICIEVLVRYGIGLEMFKDILTIQEARRRAHSITKILKDSCLLLTGNETGCIKMNNVVRDVAKTIASEIYFVKSGKKLMEWPNAETLKHYTGISVMYNQINGYPASWDCSDLQILLMQGNCIEQPMPEGVFKGMTALKVFDQSDIISKGDPYFSRKLEPGFSYLTSLRTLIIKNCRIAAPDAIGKMKMLEVLSLANCKLLDLPQEIGELTNIRLLDLEDCHHSRQKFNAIFPPNVISRWSRLEELYSSSFMKYTREHIAELKSLSHLTTLIMEVPDLGCIPEGFSFPELEVFKIAIRGSVHHKQSNYLEVCGWVNAKKFFASPSLACVKPLLKRTQYLKLSSFEGLRTIFPHQLADRDGLAGLKTLEISDCADLEYLIDSEEWKMPPVIEQHQHTCLMHLEKLDLQCLGSFKGLCHGALPAELSMSLQKLKSLGFFKCEKLINVFASLELMQRFDGLEEVSVDSCGALEYVFNLKIEKPAFEEKKMLSHLRELALCDLPAMKCIWDGPTRLLRLDNLQIADIQNCNKLKVLFDTCVAQSLCQLKKLLVKGCDELETVVAKESQRVTVDIVVFPQLVELSLLYLPNLAAFCLDSLPFKWPSLEKVEVRQCPKMETLAAIVDSDENQSTPKLKQIKLDEVDLILHGRSLNMFIQKYFEARELRNLINDHQSRVRRLTER